MRLVAHLSNGLGSTAFFLIAIAILAGGCNHPHSKNDGNTTASSAVLELSQTLVGKRITIRGKLLTFKCGQGIELEDGEIACLVQKRPIPVFTDPYPEMYDKLVEATGTLGFYHNPTPIDETRISQREQDHYYFEYETTQVRRITSAPADLQITSPVSGTIVQPGQSFSVSVASPNSTALTKVIVVAEGPFGFSTLQNGVPARVSFTVPAEIACQSYAFTAMGTTASGGTVESVPILIDVERPDLPTSVSTPTSKIMMSAPGETAPLILLAKFADGLVFDVTHSSRVAYSSTDTRVATIDADGIVTAMSPGRVFVTAAYTAAGKTIPTAIAVSVPTPTLTPSKFSVTFGNQAVGTASPSQSVTLTNTANAPVRAISLNATGDFSESDNCRSLSPLPSGGKCVVNVTFKPAAAGTRPGTLVIVNSSDVIPTTLPLSGSGIGP